MPSANVVIVYYNLWQNIFARQEVYANILQHIII